MEVLEMLIGTGLDKVWMINLLTGPELSGQRPMIQEHRMDQRSSSRVTEDQGVHQSAQSGSLSSVGNCGQFRQESVLRAQHNMGFKWYIRCGIARMCMQC